MNIALLIGSILGVVGAVGHLLGGAHIPRNPLLLELDPLDAAYLRIAWNVVGVMMLAMSSIELHIALTPQNAIGGRKTIIWICSLAWLLNGLCFIYGVGTSEAPPWICITNSVLVGIGSLMDNAKTQKLH